LQSALSTEEQITGYQAVNAFLSNISRNSRNSKYAYQYGLTHFQKFLKMNYSQYNIEDIIKPLSNNELDIYVILDEFVSYLVDKALNLTSASIKLYIAAVRSYFAYYDINIIPSKFRRKVKMPKMHREDEGPLDAADIRKILLSCNNRRLKAYLLVLTSGGMRAMEALAIRLKDIDFTDSPTKIHIRKEYSKTKTARDIYISDEATQYLKQWINWKYNNEERLRIRDDDDLIFTVYTTRSPYGLYVKALVEFEKLLSVVGLDERREGKQRRRKITLHSIRRFVKTVISDQTNTDYSEWFLGHNKSPYYTKKEAERREIYATKCMKYLTFLDYTTLEATGKSIEAKLSEKEKEIQLLKQRDSMNSEAIANLSDQLMSVVSKLEEIEKKQQILT
jgi:integrase